MHGDGRGAQAAGGWGALGHRLRNYLLAGVVVAAPISITLFIVWQVLRYVDETVIPFIPRATTRRPTCRSACRG